MAFDYAELAATATELLTEFGQTVTRRAYTAGAYDTDTGTAALTVTESSRIGVALPFADGVTEFRGTLIQRGDLQVFLDPADAESSFYYWYFGASDTTDRYVVGGQEYTVVSFERLAPAGVPVLYTLHVRLA